MKSEWKKLKIGDVCTIKHGYAFKGVHFCDEKTEHIVTTPGNFAISGGFKLDKPKYYRGPIPQDYILSPGDIIVTMTDLSKDGDTLGYAAIVPESNDALFLHNQRIGLIENISDSIDKGFLYWLMRTYHYQKYIVNHASGSTVKHTSPSSIASYSFQAPPLPIQRKIASILSALDEKIETNNAICRNLEEQAMALYKSWFVDFEPFQKCVFEESEIGMIPRGWRVSKMSDFFPVITGKKNANVAGEKGQYPFFSCSQDILWTDDHSFEGNAILVAGNGDFNVKRYNGKFEAYQRTYVLIPDNSELAGILYYAISKGLSDITMGARGSVINFITKGNIADYKIAIPENLIEQPLITTINSLNETIDNLDAETLIFSQLRNTILPKLMSGELSVESIN